MEYSLNEIKNLTIDDFYSLMCLSQDIMVSRLLTIQDKENLTDLFLIIEKTFGQVRYNI